MQKFINKEENQQMRAMNMNKQEYDKYMDEKNRKEHPEDYEPQQIFLEEEFKNYCKEKYTSAKDITLFQNSQILQMIYALEWYDVSPKDPGYQVEYHPYLTKGDYQRLQQLNTEHQVSNGVTFVLTSLIANRFLLRLQNPTIAKFM